MPANPNRPDGGHGQTPHRYEERTDTPTVAPFKNRNLKVELTTRQWLLVILVLTGTYTGKDAVLEKLFPGSQDKANVGRVEKEVADLKAEVDAVKENVASVKSDVGQMQNTVGQMQNTVNQIQSRVDGLFYRLPSPHQNSELDSTNIPTTITQVDADMKGTP